MDLKQLQYFLELANQEHMSSTADLLNISQPALSKSIANLEKEVGTKLFDRHKNHIKLNESGKKFAEYAEKCLQILQNGILEAKQARYDYQGVITIMCYTFSNIMTGCILEYQSMNPGVKFVVKQESTEKVDVSCLHNVDFLLCADYKKEGFLTQEHTWVARPVFQEECYFFISPKYYTYPDSVVGLDAGELRDDLFVVILGNNLFFSDLTYAVCQAAGFLPKVYFKTNDFLVKTRIVGEGRAIAIMPECCGPIVKALFPDLRQFRIENYDTKRTIYLMHRKEPLMSEVARDFFNFAVNYFGL